MIAAVEVVAVRGVVLDRLHQFFPEDADFAFYRGLLVGDVVDDAAGRSLSVRTRVFLRRPDGTTLRLYVEVRREGAPVPA